MKKTLRFILALACFTSAGSLLAEKPFCEKTDIFVAGNGGYQLYHIPGITVSAKGTVLAWCEARENGGDWDKIDLLLRRSEDHGKTWGTPISIGHVPEGMTKNPVVSKKKVSDKKEGNITVNNPVIIADRDGSLHLLYCVEYLRCFYRKSSDDGLTWSEPKEITEIFEKFGDYKNVIATGPNHGIQLTSGRLIAPAWISSGTGKNAHRPSEVTTVFSDDGGNTWQAGEIAVRNSEDGKSNPNETIIVELSDGRVQLNVRNEAAHHRRLIVTSPDGSCNWTDPVRDDQLIEPICMGGIVRVPDTGRAIAPILFSNPHNLFDSNGESVQGISPADSKKKRIGRAVRKNLSVKLSLDDTDTWSFHKVLEPGMSMYSDLAVAADGTILCFYGRQLTENGTPFAGDRLTVARFNASWLTDGAILSFREE